LRLHTVKFTWHWPYLSVISASGCETIVMNQTALKNSDQNVVRSALELAPEQFEELARLMVEADPQAAIRAFGAAMQDVEIQKREAVSSEAVAA
jgi:hypothetical protein